MKKITLLFCLCALFSCKKKDSAKKDESLSAVKWVLESAVSNVPMPLKTGGTTTDYIAASGPESCVGSNYTLTFLTDGTYQFSSIGALCDMVSGTKGQTWIKKSDNTYVLNNSFGTETIATLNGDKLTYTTASIGVFYFATVYTFKATRK